MTEDTYSSAALEELIKLRHDNQISDFWIGGDFNLPDVNWSSLTVTSNQYSYTMTDIYLDILRNCNVEQIACVTDIDMLQTYGTHTSQQHYVTL